MNRARGFGGRRGIALVSALTFMTLLLAVGAGLTLLTTTETRIAANDQESVATLLLAESAVALAIAELRSIADWQDVLSGAIQSSLTDGAPPGVRILANGEPLDLIQERPAPEPAWRVFAYGWPSAWLGGGPIEPRAYAAVWLAPGADPDSRVLIGRAYGARGARRTVEISLRRTVEAGEPVNEAVLQRLSWRER